MEAIMAGIYAEMAGNGTLSGVLTGGIYWVRAPQSADPPYAVIHLNADMREDTFTEEGETYQIQINAFEGTEGDDTNILDIFSKMKDVLDYANLTVAGYNHIVMKRDGNARYEYTEDEVWQLTMFYEAMIQKSK